MVDWGRGLGGGGGGGGELEGKGTFPLVNKFTLYCFYVPVRAYAPPPPPRGFP